MAYTHVLLNLPVAGTEGVQSDFILCAGCGSVKSCCCYYIRKCVLIQVGFHLTFNLRAVWRYSNVGVGYDTIRCMKIRQITLKLTILLLVLGSALLSACSTEEPVQIIITPTSDPGAVTDTPSPTVPVPATATATLPEGVEPSPTFRGPVIGDEYELPTLPPPTAFIPTATPQPDFTATTRPASPTPTLTPGPTSTPLPRFDASRIGLQMYTNLDYNEDWLPALGFAETTGVGWIKIQLDWGFIQPNGPDEFPPDRFFTFQQQLASLDRAGFQVLVSVAKAPNWARSNLTEAGPPDNPQALATFLTRLFAQDEGKVGQAIDAIEVWNEPNLIREWRGALAFTGAGYMELFRPAYDAIRAYSPTMTIVTAGLAPTSTLPDAAVDDRVFLQQMYDAGLGNYRDVVVGVHPYGWGNAPDETCCDNVPDKGWDDDPHFFFLDNIRAYRDIMNRNGHEDVAMWWTEFGWATWEGNSSEPPEPWVGYNSAQDQLNYTIRAIEIGFNTPGVGVMFLWNLNFATPERIDNRLEQAAYSIINPALPVRERPLFWALAEITGTLDE